MDISLKKIFSPILFYHRRINMYFKMYFKYGNKRHHFVRTRAQCGNRKIEENSRDLVLQVVFLPQSLSSPINHVGHFETNLKK